MLLSPIMEDIDTAGVHPYYNWQRYAFECATLNPRQRLQDLARPCTSRSSTQGLFRSHFEKRVREGNFEPFYFTTDEKPYYGRWRAEYIAEFMAHFLKTHGYN